MSSGDLKNKDKLRKKKSKWEEGKEAYFFAYNNILFATFGPLSHDSSWSENYAPPSTLSTVGQV